MLSKPRGPGVRGHTKVLEPYTGRPEKTIYIYRYKKKIGWKAGRFRSKNTRDKEGAHTRNVQPELACPRVSTCLQQDIIPPFPTTIPTRSYTVHSGWLLSRVCCLHLVRNARCGREYREGHVRPNSIYCRDRASRPHVAARRYPPLTESPVLHLPETATYPLALSL